MKRFIDLGNQTGNIEYEQGEREFAFYCTVKDCFEVFSGNYTWNSVQDFTEDYKGEELDRFLQLIPNYIDKETKYYEI
jgi:hypothetical protein